MKTPKEQEIEQLLLEQLARIPTCTPQAVMIKFNDTYLSIGNKKICPSVGGAKMPFA